MHGTAAKTQQRPPLDLYSRLWSLSGVVGTKKKRNKKKKKKAKLKPRRRQCLFLDHHFACFALRERLACTHSVDFGILFDHLALHGGAEMRLMARVDCWRGEGHVDKGQRLFFVLRRIPPPPLPTFQQLQQ
jgi:hypothetical protein